MSIDSLGNSGSRDAGFEARRRSLEEDRARELRRIEERRRLDVSRAEEEKDRAIESIHERQQGEIESERERSDERIERVRAESESRIRSFEQDAQQMADNARKQFQGKADALARSARELEQQRDHLLTTHSDTMTKLSRDHEDRQANVKNKLQRESARLHQNMARSREEMERNAELEIGLLRQDIAGRKTQEKERAERDLQSLQNERDFQARSIQEQVDFYRRSGNDQLVRARDDLEARKIAQELEHEDRMHQLTNETRRDMSRAQQHGRDNVEKTRQLYADELSELRKGHIKKVRDMSMQAAAAQAHIEGNNKIADHIAQQQVQVRRQLITEQNDKMLQEQAARSTALRAKLDEQFGKQATGLTEQRARELAARETEVQKDLIHQKARGQAQVSAVVQAHAEKVADHKTKAADPFYRLHDLEPKVSDSREAVTLEVEVPEHERESLKVTHRPGFLILSGTRRAEAKAQTPEGGSATTHSYQSFTKSIPIQGVPVMAKMTKGYVDGSVVFRIPKA